MDLKFLKNKGFQWFKNDRVCCKGYFFIDNDYYHNEEMLTFLSKYDSMEKVLKDLKALNGCFSFSLYFDNKYLIVCDSVRSIPVYYKIQNDKVSYLSDHIKQDSFSANNINDVDLEEFKLTGYISSQHTLIKDMYQLEAGTYIIIDEANSYKIDSYIKNYSETFSQKKITDLEKNLNDIFEGIANRLIKILNGKTAVIPLSGGYDSRIIALMFHEKKYKNVLCFTYGRSTSAEVKYSKIIAERLGFKWVFVEYTDDYISDNWDAFKNYYTNSFDFVSSPHVQDFFALHYLSEQNLIPKDSYLIPGHSGDLLGGSHLRKFYKELKGKNNLNQIAEKIYNTHYYHSQDRKYKELHIESIYNMIKENINHINAEVSLTDYWNINNRQAKYIINSVRAYEHFGLKWSIPLWDTELARFFYALDLSWKIKNNLYNRVLEDKFNNNNIAVNLKIDTIETKIKNLLRKYLPLKIKIKLKKAGKKQIDVNNFDFIMQKLDFNPDYPVYHINAAVIHRITKDILNKD